MTTVGFVSANGDEWTFDGTPQIAHGNAAAAIGRNAEGVFEAPDELVIDPRTGLDGGALVSRRAPVRRVVLPLELTAAAGSTLRTVWASLFAALRAGGTLTYTAGATTRELRQVVLEGVDRAGLGMDMGAIRGDVVVVTLVALDPWWYGPLELTEIDLAAIDGTGWEPPVSWAPDLPWNGGDAAPITVDGDTGAAPVFTIEGPVDEVIVARSGLAWAWQSPLGAGEGGTVDCRPGRRGPRLGSEIVTGVGALGDVRWQLLTEQSRLFTLEPGSNTLAIGVAGASTGATLTVGVEPRYLVP